MTRAEGTIIISLGAIVHDAKGEEWIFCGWPIKKDGSYSMYFIRSITGRKTGPYVWQYEAAYLETLTAKFPDLMDRAIRI